MNVHKNARLTLFHPQSIGTRSCIPAAALAYSLPRDTPRPAYTEASPASPMPDGIDAHPQTRVRRPLQRQEIPASPPAKSDVVVDGCSVLAGSLARAEQRGPPA